MTFDDLLLLGRIAFVVALYLFLVVLALLLRRELRTRSMTAGERAPADLLVIEPHDTGYEPGERIALLATSTLGRSPENQVVLDDTFISAEHATLRWNGRQWTLEDHGSTNGTEVNGRRVKTATSVKLGDIVQLGRVKFKLVPQ